MLDISQLVSLGSERAIKKTVSVDDTVGNSSLYLEQFLSTSACINMVVRMATEMVDQALPQGFISVGYHTEITHEEPTMMGAEVSYKVVLKEIDGNRLTFDFEISDKIGIVGCGKHVRAVVNYTKLLEKAKERMSA